MNDAYFTKLDNSRWGVTVRGDLGGNAAKRAGDLISIQRRDGTWTEVRLGSKVTSWNAGRAATYTIARSERRHA